MIDVATVRDMLDFDPETGEFAWRNPIGTKVKAGQRAGNRRHDGYWRIRVCGELHLSHRLAWLHAYGVWPTKHIDHINGDTSDNRLCNLRDASRAENAQNQRTPMVTNTSGLLGVSKDGNRWRARIYVAGHETVIGHFDTPQAAHSAYVEAKRRDHAGCTI